MTAIVTPPTHVVLNPGLVAPKDPVTIEYDYEPASTTNAASLLKGDSVFSGGLMTLYMFMEMLSEQANGKYAAMNEASEKSRTAQQHLSAIDALIAAVSAEGDNKATGALPEAVQKYIEENKLEISGVCGFVNGEWKWTGTPGSLNQAQLNAVKGSLENVANRASDFVSSSQLQLQKIMQTYNVSVSLINSLQTMLADMNKTIAQGIR
ncbi:secretion protein EspA [Pantoea sp. PNT02]|uniref:secretion protein EspA n=1 Tax=Pantoea sp. PNT02 TaxID=2769261 RepID=UPI00177EA9EC|nr:secretion protein EspA [Pantoea sp. PNT02]MBD9646332.1 secretion protein EspA [Pantoea sp. PNT02]